MKNKVVHNNNDENREFIEQFQWFKALYNLIKVKHGMHRYLQGKQISGIITK